MTVKIFIRRTVTESFEVGLTSLLHEMRSACLMQEGYVSGQTLKRLDVPGERLVVSVWRSLEDWESWYNSAARRDIQLQIDSLLGEDTVYEIYH